MVTVVSDTECERLQLAPFTATHGTDGEVSRFLEPIFSQARAAVQKKGLLLGVGRTSESEAVENLVAAMTSHVMSLSGPCHEVSMASCRRNVIRQVCGQEAGEVQ